MRGNNFFNTGVELVAFYRENPVIAAAELLGVDLAIPQAIILDSMWKKPYCLVTAGRGSGKCVVGDTLIPTSKGFYKIKECSSVLDLTPFEVGVKGKDGLDVSSHCYYDGKRRVNEIITFCGYSIAGTDEHKILVRQNGESVWKTLKDIQAGDKVIIDRGANLWSDVNLCSEDISFFDGLSCPSFIPGYILKSSSDVIAAYIRGIFEVVGSVNNNFITLKLDFFPAAKEIHTILLNFGIISQLKQEFIRNNKSYNIYIKNENINIFNNKILKKEIKNIPNDFSYFIDSVVSKTIRNEDVYDLVVPKSNSFVSNGFVSHNTFLLAVFSCLKCLLFPGDRLGLLSPSFRQSKLIFAEVRKLYDKSPILREACPKKPTMAADRCYLQFSSPKNKVGSLIEALPLGTGDKIRGARYYCLLLDEMAQIPSDIIDVVIRPMGATSINPMERVRHFEKIKDLKSRGIEVEDLFDDNVNKIIGVSSAFYTFNHMYEKIQRYEEEIKKGSNKHAIHFISYDDMPEGFLDENNIKEARESMPEHLFEMEYRGIWRSDSDGAFKASLLESSKSNACLIKLEGSTGKEYVMGIDPARASDAFAVCIGELGDPSKLVYALKLMKRPFPELRDVIFNLANLFGVSEILLDAGPGGGGLALKDLLADDSVFGANAILDREDPDLMEKQGRKILRLFQPSPTTNAEAAYGAVTLLEQGKFILPFPPRNGIDAEDEVYETISELYKQLIAISITETRSGQAHFDVAGGGHGGAKKDLYSAYVLMSRIIYERMYGIQIDDNSLYFGGVCRPIERVGLNYGRYK